MISIDRQHSVGFTIRSLSNLMRRKMCELSPPPPDHPSEIGGQIMGFLCDHPEREIYQRDLEEIFCIRRSTASRFLKDLERGGMLLRQSVPQDARLKRLIPTQKALSLHEQFNRKARQMEDLLVRDLTEEEIAQFLSVAHKIMGSLTR